MKNKIDWSNYKFRASQCSKLLTGKIERISDLEPRIKELEYERDNLVNSNGRKVKWTKTKENELISLIENVKTPLFKRLPKTLTSELRKIHRSETFSRNFSFTNKYVQKGIDQEEDAITLYQNYRNKVLGINTFFINNKKRLENDWISGEADLTDTNDFESCNEGFDTKASWELSTFPYKEDDLDYQYQIQNQCYMWLGNCNKWTTAYCLVNNTEHLLNNEKQKWYYALGLHKTEGKSDEELIKLQEIESEKYKELEVRLIFDYEKFVGENEHIMEVTKKEWFENNYDIPLENRVIEKVTIRNEDIIEKLKSRIMISREYLKYLDKNM